MTEPLIQHIRKFADVEKKDEAALLSFFTEKDFKKKENLQKEGEVCKAHFFVLKGCLRMFFINDRGVEQTTYFALENWWLTDYFAFQNQAPSNFYIQAVENTRVMSISFPSQEHMLKEFPQMERYFRQIYQKACAAAQVRLKFLYDYSREELYHQFSTAYPEFVQRVPQYLLASFLGFTPEYLSEIRKKKRS